MQVPVKRVLNVRMDQILNVLLGNFAIQMLLVVILKTTFAGSHWQMHHIAQYQHLVSLV